MTSRGCKTGVQEQSTRAGRVDYHPPARWTSPLRINRSRRSTGCWDPSKRRPRGNRDPAAGCSSLHPTATVPTVRTRRFRSHAVRSLITDPLSRAETTTRGSASAGSAAPLLATPRRWRPAAILPAGGTGLGRTARAAMSALVVAMRALPRGRCDDCNAWVQPEYRYCPSCGARLRGATPLIATGRG